MTDANVDGSEKFKLLLIAESNQARCFRSVRPGVANPNDLVGHFGNVS